MPKNSFPFAVKPWVTVEENNEYSTPIFNLLKRRTRLDASDENLEGDFYILEAPPWINVIPISPKNEVVLVEQFRHGTKSPTLEIPGGMVDAGEQPLAGAKRELLEETGYSSENWNSLGKVSSNPSMMNNFTHMFVAEDCEYVGAENPDEHERIDVHKVPMQEFLDYARDGIIHHAIVLAAVARYLLMKN